MATRGGKDVTSHKKEESDVYASAPVAPLPTELPIRYQEGDPVEYEAASNRSYAAKLRAKEASSSVRGLSSSKIASERSVIVRSPQGDGRSDSEAKILAAGYWLFSPGERPRPYPAGSQSKPESRVSPYRKNPNQEQLLNVLSTKPRSVTTPIKSDQSSPDPRRTQLQDVDRVIFLEKKLQESNEKCRVIERQYHNLLSRQVEMGTAGRREGEARLETHVAEETTNADPTLASEGSVEGLLRQVLDELRDLKVRMNRIESATARLERTASSHDPDS